MKTITSLFLSLIITTQFAFATTSDGLKQAMDEFHFAMTVEWDQRDQIFAQDQQLKFQATIEKLIVDGLTLDQLKAAFNKNSQLNVDHLINEISEQNITDSQQVQKYILQRLESSYAKGANWTGEDIGGVVAGVLLFAALGVIAVRLATCGNNGRPAC
jgi:hypothetical protein